MPTLRDRLRETADKLRGLGGPTDELDRRITSITERATSEMMINPDWGVNMELVDTINSTSNDACYERVFRAIRRRLWKPNPKIQLLTLTLLETCVKNTGTEFHQALVISEFWDDVIRFADPKKKADLQVQDKVLVLVEDCANALQPPGYKMSYDTVLSWGVRFPTRSSQDIGAGFNLPPTSTNTSGGMTGVSEADQKAIEEALRDLSTEPQPAPAPVQSSPSVEGSTEKIKSDLRVVSNSIEVLKEALSAISTNEPELVHQDYITDIRQQCVEIVPKLKKLITTSTDETILAEALYLNDELGATLTHYDRVSENAKKGAIGVIEEEPELMSFDDQVQSSQPPPPPARVEPLDQFGGQEVIRTTEVMVDPFEELASQTPSGSNGNANIPPPPPPAPPVSEQQVKEKDPFEDLIKF
eukprot:g7184.t1